VKLKNEIHGQQGEQKRGVLLSREGKRREGEGSQKDCVVMASLSGGFIKILVSWLKGSPLYPYTIGFFELLAIYAFLSISDWLGGL
jgi:hypothetical protein